MAARFSRDGAFLALVLKNIQSGDAEQVWLYSLASERLVPVTNPQERLIIDDLAWSEGGTLYVKAKRFPDYWVARPFVISATMASAREITELPAEMTQIFKQASKRLHFGVRCCLEENENYALRTAGDRPASGVLSMRELGSDEWKEIASGGPELLTFLLDPTRSQVLFPALGQITSFDLQTRRYGAFLELNNPVYPFLLDQTQDGRIVAYIEAGACLWDAQPVERLRIAQPVHVCFVTLK